MDFCNNIIFIIIDTLREDYSKPIENALSKFDFVSLSNTIAPAPWTVPSHASIFTGLYPSLHRAHETKQRKGFDIRLKNKNLLSTELLKNGYNTHLLTANPYIRPSVGFRGFESFYEYSGWGPRISLLSHEDVVKLSELSNYNTKMKLIKHLFKKNKRMLVKGAINMAISPLNLVYPKIVAKARNWPMDKGVNRIIKQLHRLKLKPPNFVFINLMEVHEPYFYTDQTIEVRENLLTGKLNKEYASKWRRIYPKEVEYVTNKLLKIIETLTDKNMFDNSLVIITSDHGQLLGEHGRIGHNGFLYDEILRIPLFIKPPKWVEIDSITQHGYISLTKRRPFIINFVKTGRVDVNSLYSEVTFAESYGIGGTIVKPITKEEKENIDRLEKYRIAIYFKKFKGIFNVANWEFESMVNYDPNAKITEDIIKRMKKEVFMLLKNATLFKNQMI